MCGFNLPRLLPIFNRYHMSTTKTTIPLVLAALFVGSTNTVESSVRGAFERELRQEFSIVSTMILLGSVLIVTHVSHAIELQVEQSSDDKNERARCEDEKKRKKRVEEVERLRAEMEASAALALDTSVAENVQKTIPLSTEPLLSPEGCDGENEASGPRLKRTSTWKDVVTRLSIVGDIDIDELDNSDHDEEIYASVNEARDKDVEIETDSNQASGSRRKSTLTWKDVVTRLSIGSDIDINELDNSDHDEVVYASVNEMFEDEENVLSEDKNEAREEEEGVADEEDTVVADANGSIEKENLRMSVSSVKSTKSSVEVEDRRSLNRTSLGDVSCN